MKPFHPLSYFVPYGVTVMLMNDCISDALCVFLFFTTGMMLGGGCGKELAHWIIHGRPEMDMYGYDIRYGPTKQNVGIGASDWHLAERAAGSGILMKP